MRAVPKALIIFLLLELFIFPILPDDAELNRVYGNTTIVFLGMSDWNICRFLGAKVGYAQVVPRGGDPARQIVELKVQ